MMLRGGAIAGAAATFPAPAISQGIREFKMATSWPKGTPGLDSSAKRIGQAITAATGKRIQVSVFAAGELVKSRLG
jgi:TRAP-type mannitol/chloroaromatic compound transport system substrate-binding protein